MKSRKRSWGRWLIASAGVLTAALAALALLVQRDKPAPERPLSRLEQEAVARFSGSEPYVTFQGRKIAPTNAAHRLQMKVHAYQHMLAAQAEQSDPTFPLKAEAELERRHPLQAAVEWIDVTGNRELNFNIEDSSSCGFDGNTELTLAAEDVARYPCLTQSGTFWEPRTELKVHLTPITRGDRLWAEMLDSTKKALATAAHLANADAPKGS
jgi:hypothetical protein